MLQCGINCKSCNPSAGQWRFFWNFNRDTDKIAFEINNKHVAPQKATLLHCSNIF